jgi:hypothetical protein
VAGAGGFETVNNQGSAKNVLTVGASTTTQAGNINAIRALQPPFHSSAAVTDCQPTCLQPSSM